MSIDGRLFTAGMMVVVFAAMVLIALSFAPGARTLPLVIGIPGLILTLIQFWNERRDTNPEIIYGETRRREITMFLWFVAFTFGILLFGFVYAGPLLLGVYLRVSWRESWPTIAISALLLWAILYGIFQYLLGLPVFEGLITQMLMY